MAKRWVVTHTDRDEKAERATSAVAVLATEAEGVRYIQECKRDDILDAWTDPDTEQVDELLKLRWLGGAPEPAWEDLAAWEELWDGSGFDDTWFYTLNDVEEYAEGADFGFSRGKK